MPNTKDTLGPLEQLIMDALWKHGPATVRDVLPHLGKRPLAYTTVMTVMNRLVSAGWLQRAPSDGGAFQYRPTKPRQQLLAQATRLTINRLVQQYGDIALVQFLERLDQISPEKLQELRRLTNRRSS